MAAYPLNLDNPYCSDGTGQDPGPAIPYLSPVFLPILMALLLNIITQYYYYMAAYPLNLYNPYWSDGTGQDPGPVIP